MEKGKKQAVINNSTENVLSQEELDGRIAVALESMKASAWLELETNGKYTKNDKLTLISDDCLSLHVILVARRIM